MTKQYTIPVFVPHLGCPFDCVFCNQRKITGKSTSIKKEEVINTIEEYLSYFDREVRLEVGFFGGSFTGIDEDIQEDLLAIAYEYKKAGKIDGIRLSTRPDFIDMKVVERLKNYSVDIVELGVQSLTQEVLDSSGRGHTTDVVYRASELLKENNIGLGLQMMVGLPEDSFERSRHTVEEFIRLEPSCVRIYPTLVVKDTYMERLYLNGRYRPLDMNTSIDYVSEYLMMFEYAGINVIRVGLQATENMQLGRDVVAGPFHPSYGQLVESEIYRKLLKFHLDKMDTSSCKAVIYANTRDISSIVGQKSSNRKFLEASYKFDSVEFRKDDSFTGKDFRIKLDDIEKYVDYRESLGLYLNSIK